ncbi:MAG TPA: RNA 2',3'-cyclic phosphodiesterase [Myxococcota bacterium]|nr:RNA 2',3'-cyclic phosphodiesterase [Myxococcota bacterium]
MVESKRTFIAVNFAASVLDALADLQGLLRKSLGDRTGIKWVSPANIHLTLQFLGQVDTELLPLLIEELSGAFSKNDPFEVGLRGAGCFPSPSRPRVIWAGITDGAQDLEALYAATLRMTEPMGFEREKRPFKPHLTLGRVKDPGKLGNISGAITRFELHQVGSCQIDCVDLMASELRPRGPVYTTLDSFPLGK